MHIKRPGALARRTVLKRSTDSSVAGGRLARTERLATQAVRSTSAPKRRRRRKRTGLEEAAYQRFLAAAGAQPHCANCPSTGAWHPHHAGIYEQKLRALGMPLWHPDNALRLCVRCHMAHHRSRAGRLALEVLRDENIAYAFRVLGAAAHDYLSRRYKGVDARVDCALREIEQVDHASR